MRLDYQDTRNSPGALEATRTMDVAGKLIELDPKGYLLNLSDWSPAVAEQMAEEDSVALNDDHWLLISFLHRFYKEYEIAPEIPILSRNLCKDQHDCRWTKRYIEKIFPNGAKSACRYAGLPAPVGRSCL
ncbi:MAG: TusE/DsrC/DsvC family sulfur relay protein [Candidatus Thiodiazotropha sp. (ex Notomyrtea botanica)]|nr:TusE/DsrC/DsvC family sulfur relay protein [Candidatus Thiodiazotropha sp. (ex Notomyrtea botanica)]